MAAHGGPDCAEQAAKIYVDGKISTGAVSAGLGAGLVSDVARYLRGEIEFETVRANYAANLATFSVRTLGGGDGQWYLSREWTISGVSTGSIVQEVTIHAVMRNGEVLDIHFYEGWEKVAGTWTYGRKDYFEPIARVSSWTVTASANFYPGVQLPTSMHPGGDPNSANLPSQRDEPHMPVPPSGAPITVIWRSGRGH